MKIKIRRISINFILIDNLKAKKYNIKDIDEILNLFIRSGKSVKKNIL